MKIIGTLLVRDEIDIIKQWLDYHLKKFDEIIVTDNGSIDGTREVLAEYPVTVIDEPGRDYMQNQWVDRMIRMAIERGADWVINSDADEFWTGDYRAVIEKYQAEYNCLLIQSRNYCNTFEDSDSENPTERLIYCEECKELWRKIIFNVNGFAWNYLGNHDVFFQDGTEKKVFVVPETEAAINHYNERGWQHFRKKYIQGGEVYANNTLDKNPTYGKTVGFHWKEKYRIYATGGIEALKCAWEKTIRHANDLRCIPLC